MIIKQGTKVLAELSSKGIKYKSASSGRELKPAVSIVKDARTGPQKPSRKKKK
jgi:hypothetical protein